MSKKRPFASEGHLRLPAGLAPERDGPARLAPGSPARRNLVAAEAAQPSAGPAARARLMEGAPHTEDGHTLIAQVLDDAPRSCGLRAEDRILLGAGRTPEFGDVVALADAREPASLTLWRARPAADALRLRGERGRLELPPDAPIAGVLLAVLRALRDTPGSPTR